MNCAADSGVPGAALTDSAMMAPMIAMPSEPPTWRMLLRTAEPTPALSGRTECMAAAVGGAIAPGIAQPPREHEHPAGDQRARANSVREPPGHRRKDDDQDRPGQERCTGLDRRVA